MVEGQNGAIRALLFDFDGLILETEEADYRAWLELYRSFGLDLPLSRWSAIIGTTQKFFDPRRDLEERLGENLDWDNLEPQRLRRYLELIGAQSVMPGVSEYLQSARRVGLKIGLASCSSREWVVGHLDRLGLLPYFDHILTGDDVILTKPDPQIYIQLLQALGVNGRQAIALEDSPNGVLAAKRAGIYCVAVPTAMTRSLALGPADLCLESLLDMPLEHLIAQISEL